MSGQDPFENRLRRLRTREVPPDWRAEILGAARQATACQRPTASTRDAFIYTVKSVFTALLWPNPRAWAGLGAAWLLVFGLNFAAHEETAPNVAHHAPPPSSQMRELLQKQERLLAELTGSNEDSEADRAKSPASPPHGKRVEEFSNT